MHWHNIADPKDAELDRLAEHYRLHPLHIEDCRHGNQSAKLEEGSGYLFAVFKTVSDDSAHSVTTCDLDVFLGRDYVITVHSHEAARKLVDQVQAAKQATRADEVFYRLMDAVVDSYVPLLDSFHEDVDQLEDQVLERPTPQALSRIFATKRALITMRRVLVNTRDLAGHLQRSDSALIHRDMWPFLRDVYDHVARNLDQIEMQRDLLSGTLDIYLSSVANRTNQVMKVLTVLGTVALPSLVISGIYGMNIKGLPWMNSGGGAFIVFGIMLATTVLLMLLLKWLKWF